MIKCGSCGQSHETVAEVRACHANKLSQGRMPSAAWQNDSSLQEDRYWDEQIARREREQDEAAAMAKMDRFAASVGIVVGAGRRNGKTTALMERRATEIEPGMYRDPSSGEIYRVQNGRGSGKPYAQQLVLTVGDSSGPTHRLRQIPLAGQTELRVWEVDFTYISGGILRIQPEWRMTMDQAREFGAMYGTCCRCGRTLTREESIEAGIGPICASKI